MFADPISVRKGVDRHQLFSGFSINSFKSNFV